MASVDGYTKAGADAAFAAIDHTHDGGGGGGSFSTKSSDISSTILTEGSFLGGTSMHPGGWSFPSGAGSVGMDSSDDYGWGYDEEGLYQLTFKLWLGFPDVVPEIVTFEFIDYNGVAETTLDFQVLPSVAYRSLPGFSGLFTTQVYYSPASTVTGSDQSAHQITLRCAEAGVTFKNGNGSDSGAVKVAVTKLG